MNDPAVCEATFQAALTKYVRILEFQTTHVRGVGAESRKKIVKQLAAIKASQRATARLLGTSYETVARDRGKRVTNVTARKVNAQNAQVNQSGQSAGVTNVTAAQPTWFQTSADPTKEAKRVTDACARYIKILELEISERAGNPFLPAV